MNDAASWAVLTLRIRDLETALDRMRHERNRQRDRADYWSARAIAAAAQLRARRTPDAQQLPPSYPRVTSLRAPATAAPPAAKPQRTQQSPQTNTPSHGQP